MKERLGDMVANCEVPPVSHRHSEAENRDTNKGIMGENFPKLKS